MLCSFFFCSSVLESLVRCFSWIACGTPHAATHGFVVAILTGFPVLGLCEMLIHGLIDYGKCRLHYPLILDQSLHWACKLVWVLVITAQA